MTRARGLPLLLALAACHAPTPVLPQASAAAQPTPQPTRPPPTLAPDPQPEPEPAALPLQIARDDPSGSACEWSCADVHDCALLAGNYSVAEAASIELGCVDACLRTPERATLFGCNRPPTLEPGTCSPFLDCVAASWPDTSTAPPTPAPKPIGVGCRAGCQAFATCYDPGTTGEQIDRCVEMCQRALDQQQQRVFGECAALADCEQIMACVAATPGA